MVLEEIEQIKLRYEGFKYPVDTWIKGKRRFFHFAYNKGLKDEIKMMKGAKWEKEEKVWSVEYCQRNEFQLAYLKGENPYARYDAPLDLTPIPTRRFNRRLGKECELYNHQREGVAQIIQRRFSIIAGEMGTGKSLMMGIALELEAASRSGVTCWYVGPKSALMSVQRDFGIWGINPLPQQWLTYEGFTKLVKDWPGGKAPQIVFFDEASRLKNPTAQRTQAASAIGDGIRQDWGDQGIIVELSGTPSPKHPPDWYSLSEIACPGFLREGDIYKFKNRLAVITQKKSIDGGVYSQLVTWRNDESKCDLCGQDKNHENHEMGLLGISPLIHVFVPSVNEVKRLYNRLKGLVVVYFKKDVLSLPDKIYRPIELTPSKSMLRAAALIERTARSTIQGLTLLRELSDGFQYTEELKGKKCCDVCHGIKTIEHVKEIVNTCLNCKDKDSTFVCGNHVPQTENSHVRCEACEGMGEVKVFERGIKEVPTPKDPALEELLDEMDEIGRIVIYAGFTGSIDRIVRLCQRQGWAVIRLDGRGIQITDPKGVPTDHKDFQALFQDQLTEYPKVAFVAHPASGGLGLTLTASPMTVYFSNSFSLEDRLQSMDRIHRPGMDENKGATICDLICLPSDRKVIENLEKKKDLQSMSLGDFSNELENERSL